MSMNLMKPIKYTSTTTVSQPISTNTHGSLRGAHWAGHAINFDLPLATSAIGLASTVQPTKFAAVSSVQSINGERLVDELRELSRLLELLSDVILECCGLEAHIRAQQMKVDWLRTHKDQNTAKIEAMYRSKMEETKRLLQNKLNYKSSLEKEIKDAQQSITKSEEQYSSLINRRNIDGQELFDVERQISNANAESQFLQRRMNHLGEESQFYLSKNQVLHAKIARLRYELDENTFAQQALKLELEILEKEKITREDIQTSALADLRNSVDASELIGGQQLKSFDDQLNQEVQRIRAEFEKKTEIYRDELHRKFELDLHRYEMEKSASVDSVTKEHEQKLAQLVKERQEINQQIATAHARSGEIVLKVQSMEKQIEAERNNEQSNDSLQKRLKTLNRVIDERERQLEETLRTRTSLKKQIEAYKIRMNQYSRNMTRYPFMKRHSLPDFNSSTLMIERNENSIERSSMQDVIKETAQENKPPLRTTVIANIVRSNPTVPTTSNKSTTHSSDGATLMPYPSFNVDQDCNELRRLFLDTEIDEFGIIRILCNRSVDQRVEIRDRYRESFNQLLGDSVEAIDNRSVSKLLRILTLSSVEHDCHEIRRVMRGSNGDETILLEIYFTRTNKQLQLVKDTYEKSFQTTIDRELATDQESETKRFLRTLYQSTRPGDDDVSVAAIQKDARDLYRSRTNWQSDESLFLDLLRSRSNNQLRLIFAAYPQANGVNIEDALNTHVNKNLRHFYSTIIKIIRDPIRYFAEKLNQSLKGSESDDDTLNRVIVSRAEIDMIQIKREYEKITDRTLYTHIQSDIHGNYKLALLELLRQRIDSSIRSSFTGSTERVNETSRNSSTDRRTVQWRNPMNTHESRKSTERSIYRRSTVRTSENNSSNAQSETPSRYAANGTSDRTSDTISQPTIARLAKFNYAERRSFSPMPTMPEDYVSSIHYED